MCNLPHLNDITMLALLRCMGVEITIDNEKMCCVETNTEGIIFTAPYGWCTSRINSCVRPYTFSLWWG
jgi:UDP-N-acetylglucosamine enolpyruvyl transferase